MPELRDRFPLKLAVGLLALGVILAFVGLIPLVGDILDLLMGLIVWPIIFWSRGASYTKNPSVLGTAVVSVLIGLIPEIGDFIQGIAGLALLIYLVRREDKKFNAAQMEAFRLQQAQDAIALRQLEDSQTDEPTSHRMLQADRISRTGRYSEQEMQDPALRAAAQKHKENNGRMYAGPRANPQNN